MDLNATDEQLDFPVIYASAKNGIAKMNLNDESDNITCIFETIISHINPPKCEIEGPMQLLVSNIDYDDYLGRIAVGRVERGTIKASSAVSICKEEKTTQGKIAKLFTYEGLKRVEAEEIKAGDIIALSGISDINIGDTICDLDHPEKIPFVNIDEPTVSMTFSVNDGPLAGKEGKFVTSRHIRDRLFKELERNVSLRVKETDKAESFEVCGRGELHLSILIENMRREGFELLVSRPKVIFKEIDGVKCEPIETLSVNVPDDCVGNVIEKLGKRKAEMVNMEPAEPGHTKIEFDIPARGLIGYRTEFLTDTKGEGTMASVFKEYEPYKGEIQSRSRGVLVAFEAGTSITYGLYNAQLRGELLIGAGTEVYEGMIVGINSRNEDISINVCKEKHLTNTRASGSDEALRLVPPVKMSLEQSIEFISDDELVEITPQNIRLRKRILIQKQEKDKQEELKMKVNYMNLNEIKEKALENHIPIIMDDTLNTIKNIMEEKKPSAILEIGTAVGYSAICFSYFLNDGGKIDTIERDLERIEEAKENIKIVDKSKKINIIEGDAVEILPTLEEKYDMVFIDAAKGKYPFFLEQALRLLKDDGIIFADNILYKGYVMSDYNKHKQRTAVTHLREYIKKVTEDPDLDTEILEVGDGLAITKKKIQV